jgi:hypothetical protein
MYTVTIISSDAEIGYGEGESLDYAKEEAMESVDFMGQQYMSEFGYEFRISSTI